MSRDPLLQPCQIRHPTRRNRALFTAHESAYPEEGIPKKRYLVCRIERARAGVALTTDGIQALRADPAGAFPVFCIGDAVAAHNTHVAIHDALRLVKDL